MESGRKRKSVEEVVPRREGLPGAGTPPGNFDGKGQVLFVEVAGDLLGIDLDKLGSDSQTYSKIPPSAPICYNLKLRRYGYPLGMRHFRLNDRHYLLGGLKLEGDKDIGYSKRVYEFDPCKATYDLKDYNQVLRYHGIAIPALNSGKFAFVAILKGKIYALHSSLNHYISSVNCKYPVFEVYDPTANSWLQAPTPPFYTNHRTWNSYCPVIAQFVMNDMLFVKDPENEIYLFDTKSGWKHCYSISFLSFYAVRLAPPFNGICVSGNYFIDEDYGVMISLQGDDKVYALFMKKGGDLLLFQSLGEVLFFEITSLRFPSHYFIDLGKSDKGNKRICLILSGEDSDGDCILCISIFDVRFFCNPRELLVSDEEPDDEDCCSDVSDVDVSDVDVSDVDVDDPNPTYNPYAYYELEFRVKELQSKLLTISEPRPEKFLEISVVRKHICKLEEKLLMPVLDAFFL